MSRHKEDEPAAARARQEPRRRPPLRPFQDGLDALVRGAGINLLFERPVAVDPLHEAVEFNPLHRAGHIHRRAPQAAQDVQRVRVTRQVAPHHILQDAARQPLLSREIEQQPVAPGVLQQDGPQRRRLVQPRRGQDALHARDHPAYLILPAAARLHPLFQRAGEEVQSSEVRLFAPHARQAGQDGRAQDRTRAHARSLGQGRKEGQVQTAAKGLQPPPQRLALPVGPDAREDQRGLRERRPVRRLDAVVQQGRGGDLDALAQVDAGQPDRPHGVQLGHHLDGILVVECHGGVDHAAAPFRADRRRISPAPGKVNADRRGDPHHLVVLDAGRPRTVGQVLGAGNGVGNGREGGQPGALGCSFFEGWVEFSSWMARGDRINRRPDPGRQQRIAAGLGLPYPARQNLLG